MRLDLTCDNLTQPNLSLVVVVVVVVFVVVGSALGTLLRSNQSLLGRIRSLLRRIESL